MGYKIETKLFVLIGVFLVTCFFSYSRIEAVKHNKPPLKQYFQYIDKYNIIRHLELTDDAIKMLDLDDYLYAEYGGPYGKVNLFIGYYYSAIKAYASHSPLICYPSNGWEIISQPTKHSNDVGSHSVKYEEIITSLGNEKELVLYWYQAHHQTNTHIVKNKIDIGYNKFKHNSEQHAFVRVSVSLANSTYQEAKKAAIDFIKTFYPQFIDFITEEKVS